MGIDSVTWIKMARQLPLSRAEQEVVRRFEEDPSGRQFLPLADLLRTHKLVDESLELLAQGVQDHPGFSVARVVLARELFGRGLVLDSWNTMERAPISLTDNVLAQKLKFKMAILLGDEASARTALQHLKVQQGIDPEIKKLSDQLDIEGLVLTRDSYRRDLEKRGIDVRIPLGEPVITTGRNRQDSESTFDDRHAIKSREKKFILEFELDDSTRKSVEKFHVVPLAEVFVPEASVESLGGSDKITTVELDSTTLAEIYARQGFYSKALAIYRRLLRMAPHNDLIRLKVSEMARLDKEQRSDDLESDPVVYDRMEVVEIIDRQMRFMNKLLENLKS